MYIIQAIIHVLAIKTAKSQGYHSREKMSPSFVCFALDKDNIFRYTEYEYLGLFKNSSVFHIHHLALLSERYNLKYHLKLQLMISKYSSFQYKHGLLS